MNHPRKSVSICRIISCSILLALLHLGLNPKASAETTVVAWGGVTVPQQATNAIMIQATWFMDTVVRQDRSVVVFNSSQAWATNPPQPALSFLGGYNYPYELVELTANHTVLGNPTPPVLSNVVSISGGGPSLALKSDGTVVSFAPGPQTTPSESNIVAISVHDGFNIALKNDGTVATWYLNSSNELTNIPPGSSNIVAIAAGDNFALTLTRDGTVQWWSYGSDPAVTNVPAGLANVIAIAAGETDAMALKDDGTLVAWGRNVDGETNVPPGLSNVTQIAVGAGMVALIDSEFPPRVMATGASISNNIFSVNIPSLCGHVYDLEYATNLNAANWSWLPLVAGNGATLTLTDTNLTDQQRFYRVRRW